MASKYDFAGYSALVVEDIAEARTGYVANLKAHGFDVESADGVKSAKLKLRKKYFDFAWVDLGLEEDDPTMYTSLRGKEVIDFIRGLSDPTFVMVVTVIDDADTAREFLKAVGADDYVTKDRITTRPLSELFGRIRLGIKDYERASPVSVRTVGIGFFGSQGETSFYDLLSKLFKPALPAKLVHSVLDSILEMIGIKGNKEHFLIDNQRLVGEFWSRALGHAVRLEFSPLASEGSVKRAIQSFEKGKLKAEVCIQTEFARSSRNEC